MGDTLVQLFEEREVIAAELRRVRELEQQMEQTKRRLVVERDAQHRLEVEASQRSKEIQKAQAKVTEATTQVEVLRKEFGLLRGQTSKFEVCTMMAEESALNAEEEASLLKQELPKRLKESVIEAVESFQNNKTFERKAAL